MKSYEIRKVSPGSVFKLYFTIGAAMGFILCLILLIAGNLLTNIGSQLGITVFGGGGALQIAAGVVGLLVGSIAYGVALGLMGVSGAFIYNIFAAAVGGIVVKLVDIE